jgi:hypothetical protein
MWWLSQAIKGDLIFHEGIQSLSLGIGFIDAPDEDEVSDMEEYGDLCPSRQLLSEMVTLSPNIKFLHIFLDNPVFGNMKSALCDVLAQLTKLEGFSCSLPDMITTKLVLALKDHQNLRTVTVLKPIQVRVVARRFDPPHEEPVSYPSLETLQFYGSPTDIPSLFVGNEPQFPSLRRLTLIIVVNDVENSCGYIHGILGNISNHCPNLNFLQLSFIRREYDHPQLRVTANDLWSLRRLKHLSSLHIARVEELVVEDAELAELVANLPRLKVLRFEQEPFGDADKARRPHRRSAERPPRLTLNLLALLSNTPNQLEELSVRVSAMCLKGIGKQVNTLKALKGLSFVRSQLPYCKKCTFDIAIFLETVLPPTCAIYIVDADSTLAQRWQTIQKEMFSLRCKCSICTSALFKTSHYCYTPFSFVPWTNGN